MNKTLYIHIPFCRQKCIYCSFYSQQYDVDLARSYIDSLCKHIRTLNDNFYTVYIGGGTPTILDIDLLAKLLTALKPLIKSAQEFTIEANPESLDKDKLDLFLSKGINRISIGVQSLADNKLKALTRIHCAQEAYDKVVLAKERGFINISIDLILGVWQESLNQWQKELDKIKSLPLKHISCYILTYEEGAKLNKNLVSPLEDELVVKMYNLTREKLKGYGFIHYEISNYAKEGYECKHNINYWQNNQYIGLGPAAVSYLDGVRQENIRSVEEYIKRVKAKKSVVVFKEKLSKLNRAKETAAFMIRQLSGLDFRVFLEKTGVDLTKIKVKAIKQLIKDHLLEYIYANNQPIGVKLTNQGVLFSDTVSAVML